MKQKAKITRADIPNIPKIPWATHSQMSTTLQSAVAVWKRLMVNRFHYWDKEAYTESELSTLTWLDCTSEAAYALDPAKFKNRNDDVIKFIREHYPTFRVIRIRAPMIKGGEVRTVICCSDNVNALRLNNHRLACATTMTTNAIVDDERLEINSAVPVIKQFVTQMCDKLPFDNKRNLEIMADMFVALGHEMKSTVALENKSREDIVNDSIKKVMEWRTLIEDKSEEKPDEKPDDKKTGGSDDMFIV